MIHIKIYEDFGKKQFREVDLRQLWEDLNKYNPFPSMGHQLHYIFETIIKKMVINKEIEFLKVTHPIDDEVTFTYGGRVKNIFTTANDIVVRLYDDDNAYILGDFKSFSIKPIIVKIYNSEPTGIEKKIDFLKDTEKYNL